MKKILISPARRQETCHGSNLVKAMKEQDPSVVILPVSEAEDARLPAFQCWRCIRDIRRRSDRGIDPYRRSAGSIQSSSGSCVKSVPIF